MTSAMAQVMDLPGSGKSLLLKDKTGKRENIEFSKILRAEPGFLCSIEGNQVEHYNNDNDRKVLTISKESIKKVTIHINQLHKFIGHPNHNTVLKTSNYYAIGTRRQHQEWKSFLKGKMKTSKIPKVNNSKTLIPGECFYCNISSTQEQNYIVSHYWVLIVVKESQMRWSHFINQKMENVIARFFNTSLFNKIYIKSG